MIKLRAIPIVLTVCLIFGSFYLALSSSLAQDSSHVPTSFVYQKEELKKEIDEVARTYGGQLSEYRRAEQEFQIARRQYEQLETLASLETAIVATRQVMIKRAMVLDTYFNLMRLELINARGLELKYREAVLARIEAHRKELAVHQDQAAAALEREAIARVADDFTELVAPMRITMDLGVGVLRLSQFQALYDVTQVTLRQIEQSSDDSNEATVSAVIRTAQDERAFAQILFQFSRVEEALASADQKVLTLLEALEDQSASLRNLSLNLSDEIEIAYSGLNQTYRFLGELLDRSS